MIEGIKSLRVRRTREHAWIPQRAKRFDACYDLFSAERFVIPPGEVLAVPTGIALDIPPGFAGLVCPRCRSALLASSDTSHLICSGATCGRAFPVVDGTPVLINDENSVFAIADFTKAIADIEDEARRLNVPPGWLR